MVGIGQPLIRNTFKLLLQPFSSPVEMPAQWPIPCPSHRDDVPMVLLEQCGKEEPRAVPGTRPTSAPALFSTAAPILFLLCLLGFQEFGVPGWCSPAPWSLMQCPRACGAAQGPAVAFPVFRSQRPCVFPAVFELLCSTNVQVLHPHTHSRLLGHLQPWPCPDMLQGFLGAGEWPCCSRSQGSLWPRGL